MTDKPYGEPLAKPPEISAVVHHSETIGQVSAALAAAQGKLTNPERNKTVEVSTRDGAKYGFAYATLDSILDLARPILAEAELALIQGVKTNGSRLYVSTMLAHKSGEWIESAVAFPLPTTPQQIGSVITYGRRYTLCGLLGIAAEEDDDANAAAGNMVEAKGERRVERDPVPADIPCWEGKIVNLKEKKGTSKKTGKPWTMYTFVGEDGEEFSSFSESAMELVKKGGRGMVWQITWKQGQYGRTVDEIRPVEEVPPF